MRLRAQALARVRMAYEGVMSDACCVLAYSDAVDEVGQSVATYTAGDEGVCLYSPLSATEAVRGVATTSSVVGKLRLPLGTQVTRRDRVRITRRFGVAESDPPEYAIEGEPRETAGFLSCDLREVTL